MKETQPGFARGVLYHAKEKYFYWKTPLQSEMEMNMKGRCPCLAWWTYSLPPGPAQMGAPITELQWAWQPGPAEGRGSGNAFPLQKGAQVYLEFPCYSQF